MLPVESYGTYIYIYIYMCMEIYIERVRCTHLILVILYASVACIWRAQDLGCSFCRRKCHPCHVYPAVAEDFLISLGKVMAINLGMASTVWMVRPYAHPQAFVSLILVLGWCHIYFGSFFDDCWAGPKASKAHDLEESQRKIPLIFLNAIQKNRVAPCSTSPWGIWAVHPLR